ncbi:NACHT, LRR and PYD domains-containing protein 12-like [Xenia sp. Carnegie-2017]|uniref:NACHT, LRR and PYD domains-containing protein 12-like n=1 Tax=Xenia sp. Carnegie-2017 TaxID=2897299 RepID=UPI001F04CF11|nr:NACHT, LRR and PYD domains-containing protein 12-like [Xenia sp. Carnegie-2017]
MQAERQLTTSNSKSYPSSILVIGRPGIGKTMLTKKLIHEWKTNEDDFWRNKLVILLQCRAIKEKYITFKKMLRSCVGFSFEQFSDIYEFIMLNPERTVLMVDGLDELSLDNEDIQTDDSGSPNEKRHVITHLSMLVEGKLLPDVTVLITSRPTAERKFRDMEFARTVEIMGFFENEIKEFVEKFCHEDRNIADRILNKIEISLELRSFCYIPINTKIVCMTLKECFADDENYSPKTMTELYDRAIKVLLWQSHPFSGLESWMSHLFFSEGNQALGFLGMKCFYELQDDDEMRSIDDKGAKYFSEALKTENCKLAELSLEENIAAEGAKYLSEALKVEINCKLTELDLFCNKIRDGGAKSLSEALKSENCKLAELDLSQNNIGDEGAKSLSEALKSENCKLTELDLSFNNIGDEGAKSLSEALKSENCKLTELDLSHNSIGDGGAKSLSEALKSENCKLTELGLSYNKIGDGGAKSLSEALKSDSCKLSKLSLSDNNIGDEGV